MVKDLVVVVYAALKLEISCEIKISCSPVSIESSSWVLPAWKAASPVEGGGSWGGCEIAKMEGLGATWSLGRFFVPSFRWAKTFRVSNSAHGAPYQRSAACRWDPAGNVAKNRLLPQLESSRSIYRSLLKVLGFFGAFQPGQASPTVHQVVKAMVFCSNCSKKKRKLPSPSITS